MDGFGWRVRPDEEAHFGSPCRDAKHRLRLGDDLRMAPFSAIDIAWRLGIGWGSNNRQLPGRLQTSSYTWIWRSPSLKGAVFRVRLRRAPELNQASHAFWEVHSS